MKISDLPPGLRELAERRLLDKPYAPRGDALEWAFVWGDTPEGSGFWLKVFDGNFAPFYNCRVVNFRLKDHVIS